MRVDYGRTANAGRDAVPPPDLDEPMIRLRRFAPLLLALLVVAGVRDAWTVRAWAELARVSHSSVGPLSRDVLSADGHLPAPTYLAGEGISLDRLAERGGGSPRIPIGAARAVLSGVGTIRTLAPEQSRIRSIERSHLEFAAVLAAARAGILKSLNTAHPPPRSA